MWRGQLDYNPTMASREEVMKAHKKLARNLTPMQKNVVLHIMKGKNHQQAYYAAGGKNQNKYQANQTVSRMLRQPHIREFLNSFRDMITEEMKTTVENLVVELEEARQAALGAETPQSAAAVSATMGKAKILGLDRQTIDLKSSDGSMTPRPSIDVSKLSTTALAEILAARDAAE